MMVGNNRYLYDFFECKLTSADINKCVNHVTIDQTIWGPRHSGSLTQNHVCPSLAEPPFPNGIVVQRIEQSTRDDKKGHDAHSKSILRRDSDLGECKIYLDGKDVTPLPLDPQVYEPIKPIGCEFHAAPQETIKTFRTQSSAMLFKTQLHTQNLEGDAAFHQSLYFKSEELEMEMLIGESEVSEKSLHATESESESSMTSGRAEIEVAKIPTNVTLVLKETDTFFILDLPSSTTLRDSDEGLTVEEDNQMYEYLTTGKGRNRRVFEAEAQTVNVLLKTRNTQTDRQKRKTGSTFASNWEMYDTLHQSEPQVESDHGNSSISEDSDSEDDEHKLEVFEKVEREVISSEHLQLLKIVKLPKFQDALCVIERLLANNCYNEQQKRFRGLSDPDPHREDIEYKYNLKLLWTFSNDKTRERCVTAVNWNKANPDIMAVGYGKFYFTDNTTGMVMVWNVKNPRQPERQYDFPDPVTTLCFSASMPNMLAVGFYFGKVAVINVVERTLKVMVETSLAVSPSFEACWQILWDGDEEEEAAGQEHILACFEDGRVCRYDVQGTQIKCSQIMRMARAEGKLKGTVITSACDTSIIPISRYAAALFITKHPRDPSIYYVGTNEGVIHTCSTNYYNQHVDLFSAHNGPVYGMRFSPFCNRVYVTCGEDWYLRLWVEGISDPIGEMTKSMEAVQDVDWSPTHSTILVAIRGKEINVWDIQRKIYNPQSVCRSPTNSRNTVCKFTENGRCLVVGDIDGNVHVFSLEDMPFPAFFQDDLLIKALKRALVAEPEMLDKLRKFGRLSFATK